MKKIAILFLFAACHNGDDQICDPGETRSCTCPGLKSGAQACEGDGQGWDICECPDSPVTVQNNFPPGTQVLSCGCWGFANPGQTSRSVNCSSGYSVAEPCNGFCSGGGVPWGKWCL